MRNPGRRTALLDAAIDVLAAEGARGLTFRAVDQTAGVPIGTTTNYFSDRDELLRSVGEHIFVRLRPDPDRVGALLTRPADRSLDVDLMLELMERVRADPSCHLALLELRLESARRADLREAITTTLRADLDANIAFHLDAHLPGDDTTVVVLYLAMLGLILESLTTPEVLAGRNTADLIRAIVDSIVPDSPPPHRRRR